MIGSIKGKITFKTAKYLIVEVGGIGYKIFVSPDTLVKIDALRLRKGEDDPSVSFWIHTHVRDDAIDLYGFLENEELEFFEMLISSVSGIGPKGALAILGVASLETLHKTISSGDTSYLTKVSGIGKKTAEKIVIELRDKIGNQTNKGGDSTSLQGELDALEALKSLGYSQNQAREALKKVANDKNTNEKIREALKILGGK